MTQRATLTPNDEARLLQAKANDDTARAEYRRVCVEMMGKASVRAVAELTGLSTNTLQRWKAGADQA